MDGDKLNKIVKTCVNCGTSLGQLIATKRAGCSGCYQTFDEEINRLTGDLFSPGEEEEEISSTEREYLQRELDRALKEEDYELAVHLRDQLAGMMGDELL